MIELGHAGVEYVVSEKVFQTLPAEEKQLWHSHNYEVSNLSFKSLQMSN
jgi:hypothetical protein